MKYLRIPEYATSYINVSLGIYMSCKIVTLVLYFFKQEVLRLIIPENQWDLWNFVVSSHQLAYNLVIVSKLCVPSLIDHNIYHGLDTFQDNDLHSLLLPRSITAGPSLLLLISNPPLEHSIKLVNRTSEGFAMHVTGDLKTYNFGLNILFANSKHKPAPHIPSFTP